MAQIPEVYKDYTGDGTTGPFAVPFAYLAKTEVFASVNGVNVGFTWLAGSTASLQLNAPAPAGSAVRIYRSTAAVTTKHAFAGGVPFLPRYVDENNRQLLYAVQEAVATASEAQVQTQINTSLSQAAVLQADHAAALAASAESIANGASALAEDASAKAEAALDAVEASGVGAFNGRSGLVVPVAGDYTAAMIPRGASNVDVDLTNVDIKASVVRSTIASLRSAGSATLPTTVRVAGYYAAGDGGGGFYTKDSADTTSADNGGTVIVAADGMRWKLRRNGPVSILQFGAKADATSTGGTDNTAVINAALAASLDVVIPAGNYRITNVLTMREGGVLRGMDRSTSQLFITSTYTNVAGFLLMNHNAALYDIGFVFSQPDTAVRANLIKYPWAVNFQDCNRVIMDRVRVSNGWNGLYGPGNSGGAYIGFIEIGVFNSGMLLGGGLDFLHGVKWHFWPFGFAGNPNHMAIYGDGTTNALTCGAFDGFNVENLATFQTTVVFTNDATPVIPYLIGNLQLDGDGARLLAQNGTLTIGKLYDTKSAAVATQSVLLTNSAVVDITYARVSSNARAYSMQVLDSAKLHVHGGDIQCVNAQGGALFVQSGTGILDDCTLNPAPNTIAYANAYCVASAGGVLKVRDCRWTPRGTSTGAAVAFAVSNALHQVVDSNLNGWEWSFNSAGRQAGHFEGNTGTVSSFYQNHLVGKVNRCTFLGTTANDGTAAIATGVANLHQLLVHGQAFFKHANGQAVAMSISSIDSAGNVYVTGGTAGVSVRLHVAWSDVALPNW